MKRKFVIIVTALFALAASRISAQIYTTLHGFSNADGAEPYAGLTASGSTLYGTTKFGGTSGDGAVFALNTDGSGFEVLHSFNLTDGADLTAGPTLSGSTLYGASYQGGTGMQQGALYTLNTDGSGFMDTYVFSGAPDGDSPKGGLLLSGNMLYGTTSTGTANGSDGTVFAIETNGGGFTTLHTFTGLDGNEPRGDLVLGGGGVLYGTTYKGGNSGLGAIYSIETNGANFVLLHSFSTLDGIQPAGGLVLFGGNLYGTASGGGQHGVGTVFSMRTNGANFTVLYNFVQVVGMPNTDGQTPMAGLCLSHKLLYGTTYAGGAYSQGTVFSIDPGGTNYTQLYSFGVNSSDGLEPQAPVISVGNSLYGTTTVGGSGQNGAVYALQIRGVAFTFPPSGQADVNVGSDVFFGTGAVSLTAPATPVRYQWRLNGVNIPGATTQSLSFPDVQPTNGGSVTMTISDGTDATTSDPVGFSIAIQNVANSNNSFAGAFLLGESASGVVKSSNTNATRQAGEPRILAGNPGGKSIWFRWQPSVSGTAIFTTQGSDFDTIMGVFTGTNVNNLTRVPSAVNDDDYGGYLTSRISFNCAAGTLYHIVVDGYWGASGHVVLNWNTAVGAGLLPAILQAPPRLTIASNGAQVTFVCVATNGVPAWYFKGQPTGITGEDFVIPSVGETNVGTYVAEVSGGAGVAMTEPARLEISVLEDGTSDTNSAAWDKFLDSSTTPYSNPAPTSLRKLGGGGDTRGYSVTQTFSTVGATGEPGEPNIAGQIGGSPVWYTYIAPTNGAMRINTTGSKFNTMLGVFVGSGDSFATLTNVGVGYTTNRALDGQPEVDVPGILKGQTNFIVVDGYNGASGIAHLNISLGAPVVIDSPPQDQFVLGNGAATFTVGASGSTPLYYSWQFNGTNIFGATNSSVSILNVQSSDIGAYTVVVSNLVSSATNSAMLAFGQSPGITQQPQSQTVATGGTVTLGVMAGGTPPPSYQWLFNGSDIGTNGSLLAIPDFEAGNQGTYSVVVSNMVGSIISSNALVLLNTLSLSSPTWINGAFQAQLAGVAGGNYAIQTSTDLRTWVPYITNGAVNGLFQLTDTNSTQFSHRFYRGVTN